MHDTHVSKKTIIKIHANIRQMMARYNTRNRRRVGGVGCTVEMDECHLYTRKYNVGRVQRGQAWWAIGGICRETRQMFVVISPVRDQETMRRIIFHNIQAGSTVYTDCWRGYNVISRMGLGYRHRTVNHTRFFVNPLDRDVHTNTIERSWRRLRESVPKQLSLKDIPSHVEQFLFYHHKNCRDSGEKFNAIVDLAKTFFPLN